MGLEPYERVPQNTMRIYAGNIAQTTYRAASALIAAAIGKAPSSWSLQHATRAEAEKIIFAPDLNESNIVEGDATGYPILGGGQSFEGKIIEQRRVSGGTNSIAGFAIGHVHAEWEPLIDPLHNALQNLIFVQDGDLGIEYAIRRHKGIRMQRCLWHMTHALKSPLYCDFRDMPGKNTKQILSELTDKLCGILYSRQKSKTITRRLKIFATKCAQAGYINTATYVRRAIPYVLTCRENGIKNATTSKTERTMRILNDRINRGRCWSIQGATAVSKLRLAWYYHGWRPEVV